MMTKDWQALIEAFEEKEYEDGEGIRVVWEYLDEGYGGYFDSDDPDDEPLLRFSVYFYHPNDRMWEQVTDSSYCTLLRIDTPEDVLSKSADLILRDCSHNIRVGSSYKRDLEQLSWMELDWFLPKGELN